MTRVRDRWIRVGLLVLLLSTIWCGGWQPAWADGPNPAEQEALLNSADLVQHLNAQVPPDLVFRDENHAAVRLGVYFSDKPVILNLAYFNCPNLCPLAMDGMVNALKQLPFDAGKQFEVITVSIDPADTPAVAAARKLIYLQQYGRPGVAEGWHFLTGDKATIQKLADVIGFSYAYDDVQKQYSHPTGLMILTPQGILSRYYYGIEYPARDVRLGLVEASQNKIGSLADRIILACYHYNPVTGKYAAVIQNVLVGTGLATVLGIVVLLVGLFRLERRHRLQAPRRPEGKVGA